MQNNVTELTQRLLRSLDSNYNVIDMPAVIEIISLLEKVAITKELLETTRLGKHVNELRRKTNNDSLSKRAKELVKKWRNMILPPNGQIKATDPEDGLNKLKTKKRPAKDTMENSITPKRSKLNGMSELDFSDNSNSSFKDVINFVKAEPKRDVILINSDSNSSMSEAKQDPHMDQQMPKKRGRKKGSKNHRSLIDEAESSFSSKMAVSRGNSKVKTTQELLASLQNKTTNSVLSLPPSNANKSKEDLSERAAKLTERVSIIDQKLNTNANRFNKSTQRKNRVNLNDRNERVIESGSVINDKSLLHNSSAEAEEDVIVVDEPLLRDFKEENHEKQETDAAEDANVVSSLSIEDALALLPPIDKSVLYTLDDEAVCSCFLKENKPDFSVDEDDAEVEAERNRFEFVEDQACQAKRCIESKYHLDSPAEDRVRQLHECCIPNVNGNLSVGKPNLAEDLLENGLYVNVVPNVNSECIKKDIKSDFSSENFKKYSISEDNNISESELEEKVKHNCTERTGSDDKPADTSDKSFLEWHEVIETPSYNGEILKILPYVIID